MATATKPKPAAFDAFFHLVTYFAMVLSAIAVGTIIFQIINRYVPDLERIYLDYHGEPSYRGPIRFGISTLLLTGPLLLILTGYLHRWFRDGSLSPTSAVRRWLTYLLLFAAAANIITSVIRLLNGFLEGNYTSNFVLKMLTVLLIAAAVFGFYLWELRRDRYERHPVALPLLIATAVVFLTVLVVGFTLVGSPLEARKREFDLRRSDAAQQIRNLLEDEFRRRSTLPSTLQSFDPTLGLDPETAQPFGYTKLADNRYELCVTFALPRQTPVLPGPLPARPVGPLVGSPEAVWVEHGSGKECHTFTLTRRSLQDEGIIDTQVDDQPASPQFAPKPVQ